MTKFAFVSAERAEHAVAMLCRVVGVSVSGFYAWLRAIPTLQTRAEAEAGLSDFPCVVGRLITVRLRPW